MIDGPDPALITNQVRRRLEQDAKFHSRRALQFGLLSTTILAASAGVGVLACSVSNPIVRVGSAAGALVMGLVGAYGVRATLGEAVRGQRSRDALNVMREVPHKMEHLLRELDGSVHDIDRMVRWVDRIAHPGDSIENSQHPR